MDITPKKFRSVIERWCAKMNVGVTIGNPAPQAQFDKFCERFPCKVKKSALRFVKEFGGRTPRNLPPATVVPGDFSKKVSVGPFALMSLSSIAQAYKTSMFVQRAEGHLKDPKIKAAKGIESVWFSEHWIPFADNGAGDYLCINLAKQNSRQGEQVVLVCHEYHVRPKVAETIGEFFTKLAAEYEEDRIDVEEDDVVEESYDVCKRENVIFP